MEIKWLGHSCFLIKGKEGTLITDPYHPDLGYSLGEPEADIVTLSHFHPGHSYVEGVANNPKQIKGPGEYEIGGTFITGIATFHDSSRGEIRGKNTIYLIEMDGITLCHLGDLGHTLTSQLIEELGVVDVLFSPAGEISTISVDAAVETIKQLNPHIVIPMHYKTDALARNLEPVDKFLDKMGIHRIEPVSTLSITQSSLPASTQVVVLNYT
ncbi:MAG: MBL fold metallo-hydrolase [Dehalococcoidia bacterium]|nr:MBL fold metallo-hydrolase [Dehalococcoidia bacterium]